MNLNRIWPFIVGGLIIWSVLGSHPGMLYGAPYRVLVVMSYDDQYAWAKEIKEGIDSALASSCDLKYVWLNTKIDPAGGHEKAKEAFQLYQKFNPDGVIAADDNAQSMFVVPYLKDKVQTPVMFCGVNETLDIYGYPASNVSGILERLHIRHSIAFAQLILPSIKRVVYMTRESPSGQAVFSQYQREHTSYPVESVTFLLPQTLTEAIKSVKHYRDHSDALFYETMEGIQDIDGTVYSDPQVVPIISEAYGKPIISNNLYHVESGTLCAVIKTGQEQGKTASEMLLKAMKGTPVSNISVTQNQYGKRIINLKNMKAMNIRPSSAVLKGVTLVGAPQK